MSAGGVAADPFDRAVAAAVAERTRLLPAVVALAAEIPGAPGARWRRLAGALESGDVTTALSAAHADPAAWLPLVPADGDAVVRLRRLLAEAREPLERAGGRWWLLAYPLVVAGLALVVLWLMSVLLMPTFRSLYDEFGLQLPGLAYVMLALADWLATGWIPLTLAGVALLSGWALAWRWSPRGPVVTAAFTRTLGDLVAAGLPTDTAVALAGRGVGVKRLHLPDAGAVPRAPLSHAALEALRLPEGARGPVLAALAACHADRRQGSQGMMEWLIGPVAVGVTGTLVGLVVVALFLPLFKLISALS